MISPDNFCMYPEGVKVSIVMPAYNAERTIAESIESVLAQVYPNWELLVVDDGSTDGTAVLISKFQASDSRIRALKTSGRCGPAKARNLAISAATGRLIAFLDSDDIWLPQKLSRQIAFMNARNSVFSFTAYRKLSLDGVVRGALIEVPPVVRYHDLLKSNHIGCLTAMYDRLHFGQVAMPDMGKREDYRLWLNFLRDRVVHEDYGLWLHLLRSANGSRSACVEAHGLNEPLALYRVGQQSLSSNKLAAATSQWLVYRQVEKLSVLLSLYYFSHYAIKGLVKYKTK
jgi:teichuronic acid biosynthesis glycosyltransferase TuaG